MNSFSTGSGTVDYETVRKAMDGGAVHDELDGGRRNQGGHCGGQ